MAELPPPPQLGTDALNTTTPNLADLPPQSSIDALNTTAPNLAYLLADPPPSQLSIDPLNTITPNLADLPPPNWAEMPCILLHQTWQIYPQSIEHSCLEYCYTKLGRSTLPLSKWSIDALDTITPNLADLPPSQASIDALNTTTPNLADLPQRTSTYERPFTHEGNYLVLVFIMLYL